MDNTLSLTEIETPTLNQFYSNSYLDLNAGIVKQTAMTCALQLAMRKLVMQMRFDMNFQKAGLTNKW